MTDGRRCVSSSKRTATAKTQIGSTPVSGSHVLSIGRRSKTIQHRRGSICKKDLDDKKWPFCVVAVAIFSIWFVNFCLVTVYVDYIHPQNYKHIDTSIVSFGKQQPKSSILSTSPSSIPPLSSLVDGHDIVAGSNVSWLLDFAIVGFPKCGTTSLMYQLERHPQVDIFPEERCELSFNQQAVLVRDLYQQFVMRQQPANVNGTQQMDVSSNAVSKKLEEQSLSTRQRGLKCPADLESTPLSLPHYQQYFPQTKFIIGIRHPILWFESFYNFRVHNGFHMPPPEQLIGRCQKKMYNCCTFRSNFHIFLANLGKTISQQSEHDVENPTMKLDTEQLQWIAPEYQRSIKIQPGHYNRPVFLYDVSQLQYDNPHPQRIQQFLDDLQQFLGLSQPFYDSSASNNDTMKQRPEIIWYKPGKKLSDESPSLIQQQRSQRINICESPRFDRLREVLLQQAQNASHWIVHYFLQSAPNVTVSSRNYLIQKILNRQWKRDPCVTQRSEIS